MSRPLRLQFPGSVHHAYNRGNERRLIFLDDGDRKTFLTLIKKTVDRYRWIVSSYTLMPNHFHLLVELTDMTLSRGMEWLEGCYTQYFNRKYKRVGHLLQGRFKSPLIQKETYWLEVLRYVVLNPVRAGMVTHPAEYQWSSYRATAGLDPVPQWLAADDVLAQFGSDRETARARYTRFVEDAIGSERKPWVDLVGQTYLGTEIWIQEVREKIEMRPRDSEHPRAQRLVGRATMADIVSSVARVLSIREEVIRSGMRTKPRLMAAWLGRNEGLLTLPAIAAGLRLRSGGNVSRMIRQFDDELRGDPLLREAVDLVAANLRLVAKSDERKT